MSFHSYVPVSSGSVRGNWRCKRRRWKWAPLSIGASLGNLGVGSFSGDLCVEEGSETGVSQYRGPGGGCGEGVRLPGTLRDG